VSRSVQLLDIIEAERNLKVAATSMPACRLSAACLPKPWRRQKVSAEAGGRAKVAAGSESLWLGEPPAQAPPQRGFCPGGRASGSERGGPPNRIPPHLNRSTELTTKSSPSEGRGGILWCYFLSDVKLILLRQFTKSPSIPLFQRGKLISPPLPSPERFAQAGFGKGREITPLWQRGARGDFLIKPLNISVLHRAINAICRSSIRLGLKKPVPYL